jgi:hypothetical protein
LTSGGSTEGINVGIPIPRLTFIPSVSYFAARFAILSLTGLLLLFFTSPTWENVTLLARRSDSFTIFLTYDSPPMLSFSDINSEKGELGSLL